MTQIHTPSVSRLSSQSNLPSTADKKDLAAGNAIALYARQKSTDFEAKLLASQALLANLQSVADFDKGSVVQASSLGAEDMVVTDLLHRAGLLHTRTNKTDTSSVGVFVLDTGKLHSETLALLQAAQTHYDFEYAVYQPDATATQTFVASEGEEAMYKSTVLRKACCHIRKIEPLNRALQDKAAWITGLRSEQSGARAQVSPTETDDAGRQKINPLHNWTWGDVWHYIERFQVPYNPLHDAYMPSIGCEPCTRAISVGEDFRAGRWWWEDESAKECGLHVKQNPAAALDRSHLAALEEESIYILREVAAAFERPALLFSGGKDSLLLLKLAEKAFMDKNGTGRIPYPLLMIDTGHNFPEVTEFRDRRAQELGATLIVRSVEDSMARGTVRLAHPDEPRNAHQSVTLLEAIEEFQFDALIGGARRDEEKARAKERIFSHRDSFGQWDPKNQRPELWTLFNTRIQPGEHFRVFPISNWTELDVWQYIAQEEIALPSLYYTHQRPIVERKGLLVPVTPLTPAKANETVELRNVRFRTLGDITCTCPVASDAADAWEVVSETVTASVSERGATRMDDQTSEASMEKRKKEGYF